MVNFEDRIQIRRLLTSWREELLEAVMAEPPESIRALAYRLGRDVRDVHDDLSLLAGYRIVHFCEAGRAKQPFVPYETVRTEVEFGRATPLLHSRRATRRSTPDMIMGADQKPMAAVRRVARPTALAVATNARGASTRSAAPT